MGNQIRCLATRNTLPEWRRAEKGELIHRIFYARHFIEKLYREGGGRGYLSEYPGFPLAIVVKNRSDPYSPRQAGMYVHRVPAPAGVYFGERFWTHIIEEDVGAGDVNWEQFIFTARSDESLIELYLEGGKLTRFDQPRLRVRRDYNEDGSTDVTITFLQFDGDDTVDLYLGDEYLGEFSKNTPVGWQWSRHLAPWQCFPAARYTIRHGIQNGIKFFLACADPAKANALAATRDAEGYTYDIYDPIWGWSTGEDDYYMFTEQAYHDGDKGKDYDDDAHSHGLNPYRYGYESKVVWGRDPVKWLARQTWLASSTVQNYTRALFALHILNKYKDPDYQVKDPRHLLPFWEELLQKYWWRGIDRGEPNPEYVSPRSIARECERFWSWTDIGFSTVQLPYPFTMFSKRTDCGVGYVTNVTSILETVLGFKYYDETSRMWAEKAANRALSTCQWGVEDAACRVTGRGEGRGATLSGVPLGYDLFRRPAHAGGCLVCWEKGTFYYFASSKGGGGIEYPEAWLHYDPYNMPPEDPALIPCNLEATMTYFQALRTYLHYKYHIDCPTSSLIP